MIHLFFYLVKIILFPLFFLSGGGLKFSDYSDMFDLRTDEIMGITTGTFVGVTEIVKTHNADIGNSMKAFLIGILLITGKTVLAAGSAFFTTKFLKKKFDNNDIKNK